jgi:hypothetical protein
MFALPEQILQEKRRDREGYRAGSKIERFARSLEG